MNREISNITIVAAGKGGYEIACLLKNEHFFSDAIIIVCDVSREFIDSVSSKVDKAILLPPFPWTQHKRAGIHGLGSKTVPHPTPFVCSSAAGTHRHPGL